jgi:hypothetical protein
MELLSKVQLPITVCGMMNWSIMSILLSFGSLMFWRYYKMNKVFVVVEVIPYEGDTVLRVFSNYQDALVYGQSLYDDEVIQEFDILEKELY